MEEILNCERCEDVFREVRNAIDMLAAGEFQLRLDVPDEGRFDAVVEALLNLARTLEQKFEERNKIAELTAKINAGLITEDILDHVFDSFRSLLPYNRIGYAQLEDEGRVLRAIWARSDNAILEIDEGYAALMEGSSLRQILETGVPRIINNLPAYHEAHPSSDSTRRIVEEGIQSSLTCPLTAMGKPLGFIFFSSFDRDAYREGHIELFLQIAGHLAVIIEKARLYQVLLDAQEQLESANRKLALLATMDGLTGIPNRRQFDAVYNTEWRRATRGELPLSVLLIDIDHFKKYNDTYGHQKGDDCLKGIAATLYDAMARANDFVARYGGEEFVAVLANTDHEHARQAAERLRSIIFSLNIEHSAGVNEGMVSASIGVATLFPGKGDQAESLISAADEALYRAKREGRNRVFAVDLSSTE